jgi:cold shock CspA family protein
MTALRFSLSVLTALFAFSLASAEEARGRLARIDPDKKEMQLQIGGPLRGRAMLRLSLDAKTEIFVGGQAATLKDLTEGQRIHVVFQERDGKAVARSIHALGLRAMQQRPETPLPPPRKEGDGLTGVLQRVALTDREIVLIGPGAKGPQTETTFIVPEKTPILRDGKKIAFDDLKEGETASVQAESRKGRMTAKSIQVGKASAEVPAQPATPPRRNLIPRLRRALQLADELLRQMEERKEK